jgi:hypothetical protein
VCSVPAPHPTPLPDPVPALLLALALALVALEPPQHRPLGLQQLQRELLRLAQRAPPVLRAARPQSLGVVVPRRLGCHGTGRGVEYRTPEPYYPSALLPLSPTTP